MIGVIKGTGACIPEMVMDNHGLAKLVETNDEWIRERTGIIRRCLASDETTVSLAVKAGEMALQDAGMKAQELDMIIVSTISAENVLPCTACDVQKELGAVRAVCYDLGAACSGFLLAYNTANAYIASGISKNILIIGSECLSKLVNWTDRSTCILFGDGAGAAVLSAGEGKMYQPVAYSDGALGQALTLRSRHTHNIFQGEDLPVEYEAAEYFVRMNGQEVFKFAVRKVPQAIEEVLKVNGIQKEEIALYVLHQANKRIVEGVAKKLNEDITKFPMNLQNYGNTSSASIPLLLHELNVEGKLRAGDKIVLAGFGGGLTWGATILEWN